LIGAGLRCGDGALAGWAHPAKVEATGTVEELCMTMPKLRVARPTDDIEALIPFYRDGLGLDVLYRFEDHAGFDGVMLGNPGAPYHFEFTRAEGHVAGRAPTQENLIIFYMPDDEEWAAAVSRMEAAGFAAVPAFNPYWDRHGRTFEDPDGYRVVIQNAAWEA
jgi:catechol 2,3-dioxygenase-like lactoylglutathione lyase family enzyme